MDLVFTSKRGVEYLDKQYHIVIPWGNIDPNSPVFRNHREGFFLRLLSDQKGFGYCVYRARYNLDNEDRSSPVTIEKSTAFFNLDLGEKEERVIEEIETGVERYQRSYSSFICREEGARLHYSWIDQKNRAITVPKEQTFRYPTFCPLTGDIADQFDSLPVEGGGELSWFISSLWRSGERKKRLSIFFCYTLALIGLNLSAIYTCFQLKGEVESDLQLLPYFIGSFSFYALPIFFEITSWRRGVVIEEREEGSSYTIQFADQDYFDAFVSLNGVVFA